MTDWVIDDDETAKPGKHPEYGGLNWGVSHSSHWGDWTVNHGYYGSHHEAHGLRHFDGAPIPDDLPLWTCDQPDKTSADAVWQAAERINAALRDHGVHEKFRTRGVRIRVLVTPERFEVGPYDWPDDFTAFTIGRKEGNQ